MPTPKHRKPPVPKRNTMQAAPGRLPSDVTIAEILAAKLRDAEAEAVASEASLPLRKGRTIIRALTPHFGRLTLAQLTPATFTAFRSRVRRRGAEDRTADSYMAHLRGYVNQYCKRNHVDFRLTINGLTPKGPRLTPPLDPEHMGRLLWAARGTCCLPERYLPLVPGVRSDLPLKPAWFRPVDVTPQAVLRARRRHMTRLLLICYYTATTIGCALDLRWAGTPDGEESFVDVESGLLYRLGRHAAAGKAEGMPVPIPPRLLRHLRHWVEADRREGHEYVIHPVGQQRMRNSPIQAFQSIRRDAGLGREIELRMVCLSAGVVLMRLKVHVYAGALMMGMDPVEYEKRFRRHHPDYRKAFKEALMKRPRSVSTPSSASLGWERTQAARRRRREKDPD